MVIGVPTVDPGPNRISLWGDNTRGTMTNGSTSMGAFSMVNGYLTFQNHWYEPDPGLYFPVQMLISAEFGCKNYTTGSNLTLVVQPGLTVDSSPLAFAVGTTDIFNPMGFNDTWPSIRYDAWWGSTSFNYIAQGLFKFNGKINGTDPGTGNGISVIVSGIADLVMKNVNASMVFRTGDLLMVGKLSGRVTGASECLGTLPTTTTGTETTQTTETTTETVSVRLLG